MKKAFILLAVMSLSYLAAAQNQQGYVKTKGRMVNGKIVHGQGLKGATVSVKGRTTVLVNTDDGAFSFPVPDAQFRLDSVRKKGYQLVDMDALGKTYKHSSNPLYLVMETPEQQLEDQLKVEKALRRTLRKQLQEREDEIEDLKEQQKITDEEYRQALQKLYEDTEQNDQLVKDMVGRYSKIDYDQLSEFDQKISELILNGELIKADSLLRTKGDINERVSQYKKHEAINAKEREELSQRQEQLEQSEALAIQERDDLANDCYRKFEIFKMQHLNDSAAYYIELRADLDTTNTLWQNQAGEFIWEYYHFHWTDCMAACKYFIKVLNVAEPMSEMSGRACYNLAKAYAFFKDYSHAFQGYKLALQSAINIHGKTHPSVANIYQAIGSLYLNQEDFANAISCYLYSLEINKLFYGDFHEAIAETYNGLANICLKSNQIKEAFIYFRNAIDIYTILFGSNCIGIAKTDIDIGKAYMQQGDYNTALNYELEAVDIYQISYNDTHPDWIELFIILGDLYTKLKDEDLAFQYYKKAFDIRRKTNGGDMFFQENNQGAVLFIPGALHKPKDISTIDTILNNTKDQ